MVTVFFSAGGRVKKAEFKGTNFANIEQLYRSVFYEESEDLKGVTPPTLPRSAYYLRDPTYGVFFEGFRTEDIYEGAIIDVRDPRIIADGPFPQPEKPKITEAQPDTEDGNKIDNVSWASAPSDKTWKQKLWELLDEPTSSRAAGLFTIFLLLLIVFSTTTFCLETLPIYYSHKPDTSSSWYIMEAVCISIFTFEFILRIISCPSIPAYFNDLMNCIDVIAILPFYMEAVLTSVEIPGLAVFRVVRLVRVFRLFKVSRGSIAVFASTMRKSAKPLYMLVFFTSIAMIVFSSLMYYAERGVFDEEIGAWMRIDYYMCRILVSTDPPTPIDASFPVDSGHDEPCIYNDPQPENLEPHQAYFTCPYSFPKGDHCKKMYEQSPFESIPAAFWWCLVTMTTVGYGDMVPTQWYGMMLGMIVMMFGILVIALPITVIGSNFASVYKDMVIPENDEDDGELSDKEGDWDVQAADRDVYYDDRQTPTPLDDRPAPMDVRQTPTPNGSEIGIDPTKRNDAASPPLPG
mmetsp:Transcript_5774/g.6637  ORF Transcript_5774/g.6637 Transcript_5774/m.6637 type:complete len:518 (-) Transcript_5774:12-1565(-)